VKNKWPAILILAAYLLVGTFYAVYTPRWQVPDEPAHYNYIAALAAGKGFPVLEPGDYDQQYLEQLKSEHFPRNCPSPKWNTKTINLRSTTCWPPPSIY
jgi:hypothetical protein